MVLCESHISVPAKRYKVNVNCIKTRRLTTMEWLVLSMTKKFENHPYMKDNYFKYAFEEVFQFNFPSTFNIVFTPGFENSITAPGSNCKSPRTNISPK